MTLKIECGFNVASFGSLKITVSGTPVTISSGKFCHQDISSVDGASEYTALEDAINAALTTAGVTSINVAYQSTGSGNDGYYRINRVSGFPNVVVGADEEDAAHARMGQVLGFQSSPGVLAGNPLGDALPYFTILSEMGGKSADSDDYEAASYSEDSEAEDGSAYGISTTGRAIYADWTCRMEPREVVFEREAMSAVPWTWQHFYQHCAVVHPFLVSDDFGDETVHKLRAGEDRFKPAHVQPDWRDLFDLSVKTRVLGRL